MTFAAWIAKAQAAMVRMGYGTERALATYTCLAVLLDRLADFNASGCTWNYTGGRGVLHMMASQRITMTWDFAETNPFNPDAASWISAVEDVPAAWDEISSIAHIGTVKRGSATELPYESASLDAVVSDPPYYDNVPYSDISDFFYVWLKRTVGRLYPSDFATQETPKKKEGKRHAKHHGIKGGVGDVVGVGYGIYETGS